MFNDYSTSNYYVSKISTETKLYILISFNLVCYQMLLKAYHDVYIKLCL